jgi:nucleotide-binding universal stress UspA family protein
MSVLHKAHKSRARARPSAARRRPRFEHLIVATVGDDASLGAIHLAAALAKREKAAVSAVGVTVPFPPAPHAVLAPGSRSPIDAARLELLNVLRDTLADVPGTEHWKTHAIIGMPASAIDQAAGDNPRTLIVMGLRHHGRLDRLFGGETTVPVVQHARVPVLLVSPDARSLPQSAVAAIDFSEASLAAASVAADLLDGDGTLTLAHVESFGDARAQPGDLIDLHRAGVRARLEAAVRRIRRRTRRRVATVTLHGETGDALLRYARETESELIALGGHELGLVDRVLLGSIRTKVVRGAACSVLIVPPERHEADR